ncbi:filamentous hemagglutinin N-terminal domain-containing protein [uncultured Sulfitobacter sp.]|uniref:filamentous hemagglutinin N-terminal domain-containing protein n=1 Tax=Sulfitobacter sp. SH22 TaxID=3421172 RepID=UPI0025DF4F1E|nr:filamentous hemagglutinin N-terminal domain-containing protein [uncultured Sulfitobacter sp.]
MSIRAVLRVARYHRGFGIAGLLASLFPASLAAQSVASDGGTATTITIGASGLVTVDIAPANAASISHNTYSSFSVPTAGVNLNNETVRAGTILNEVTSANITTIKGPLTVIGPKADVIVANPNGITVNGGRFQNTGNVALTTGVLGRTSTDQVTTTVTTGAIDIGPGGLNGTMEELALISKSLRIDGPLQFDLPDASSHANIITGDSTVSFDRLRGGFGQDGSGLLPWALTTDQGNAATDAVIVDITGSGSLNAGRISVTVTDQGAGVRFAGDQLASAGGFRLTSTGQLELMESSITAQRSVNVTAGSVALVSADTSRAEITSEESGVTIAARSGNINLGQGRIAGRVVSSDTLASSGGVTLTATGDITSESDGERVAELVSDAGDLPNAQSTSNVVLTADGTLRFDGLNVTITDDFRLTANGPIAFFEATGEIGGDFRAFSNADLSFDASTLTAQSDIRLDGAELRFGADEVDQARTELVAVDGGFTMRSSNADILNFGSLLQGKTTTSGETESKGGMTVYAAGDFLNKSLSVDRLAVAYGEDDDLHIETVGDVRNETGRLFSNAGITIQAGGDILNETLFTQELAPLSVTHSKGPRFASSLFLKRSRNTRVSGDFGAQAIAGEQSFILGIGDVSLAAQNIRSTGADITGANVTLNASGVITSDARQIGQMDFRQSCKWLCRTSGTSSLRFVGGTVTASQALSITAGETVSSLAGTLSGASGIRITAPTTEFVPAFSAQLIEHPAGLTGWFQGRRGYLTGDYSFGSLQSTGGDIAIDGDADLGAADLFATGEVVITGTRIQSTPPTPPALFERRPIGLLWNVFD